MSNFSKTYESTIQALEHKLTELIDSGMEFDLERNGDVLTIEFEDGEKIVITPQSPLEQLWISANYAGHRFNWRDGDWKNEKDCNSITTFLSSVLSSKLGSSIEL